MLRENILKEYHFIQEQIDQIQNELNKLPDGKLLISQDGKYRKWYVSNGHTKVYIPKKNRHLAEQLAQKKYLTKKLEGFLREKQAIEAYLRIQSEHVTCPEVTILSDSEYTQLLSSYFKPNAYELRQWASEEYERNPNYPEHLIHKTSSGIMVRSKSEAMIERFLYTNKIPFRYECALNINHVTFYPDFTILHPETRKIYYWEHFGRMDDENYCDNYLMKMNLYIKNGIIPTINLITTYETKSQPLDMDEIERRTIATA